MSSSRRNSRLGVDLDNALTSSASSAVNSETATITAIDAMGAGNRTGEEDHEDTAEQRVGLLDSETGIGEYGSIASSSESQSCSVDRWPAGNFN